jgi:hypothetical protein
MSEVAIEEQPRSMGTPQGVLLAAVVAGSAAIVTLIVAKLWPKNSDALEATSSKLLGRWRRFSGLDD